MNKFLVVVSHGDCYLSTHYRIFNSIEEATSAINAIVKDRSDNPISVAMGSFYEIPKFKIYKIEKEYNIEEQFEEVTLTKKVSKGIIIKE